MSRLSRSLERARRELKRLADRARRQHKARRWIDAALVSVVEKVASRRGKA